MNLLRLLPLLLCLSALGDTALRVIEATLPIEVRTSLDQHAEDLRNEGWTVRDVYVPRREKSAPYRGHVELATSVIWPAARAETNLHVLLIGRVPWPSSGFNLNPDGHTDTTGAYPAPVYYAMPGATWTDERDNTGYPSKPQFEHKAGDGVWDQQIRPEGEVRCAVGLIDFSNTSPKAWTSGITDPGQWQIEAYRRYFTGLHNWRTGVIRAADRFACGSYNGSFNRNWLDQTSQDQFLFRSPTAPESFDARGPFRIIYDFKALPPNGTFWTRRTVPVAAFYLWWESYQTAHGCSREMNSLLSGSACAAPLGFAWNVSGWDRYTVGQLWRQSVSALGAATWISLYGDPTFKLR